MTRLEFGLREYYQGEWADACEDAAKKKLNPNEGWSFKQLQVLRDMARDDVYPDGHFGDEDCNVWSMFRSMKY